jgi:hypothetical protein
MLQHNVITLAVLAEVVVIIPGLPDSAPEIMIQITKEDMLVYPATDLWDTDFRSLGNKKFCDTVNKII